jgi:hypothetical protein
VQTCPAGQSESFSHCGGPSIVVDIEQPASFPSQVQSAIADPPLKGWSLELHDASKTQAVKTKKPTEIAAERETTT